MDSVGPDGQINHFLYQRNPGSVNGSFGDPDFRRHFCQKFSCTFIKTLALEPIGFDGKINLFSTSNKSRKGFLMSFFAKPFRGRLSRP
ncbi:hypothetical protein H5410_056536 [Solanum commersonii]|uniref:Uncharacterized protein n=1 Tax=Solanum commersonii TaxID=4109 RepID=A0A9J5WLK6_SOLCO|nr:hypothetical protein H5410_056536 [Solanum commersonii]